jgi:hypothetical protein
MESAALEWSNAKSAVGNQVKVCAVKSTQKQGQISQKAVGR